MAAAEVAARRLQDGVTVSDHLVAVLTTTTTPRLHPDHNPTTNGRRRSFSSRPRSSTVTVSGSTPKVTGSTRATKSGRSTPRRRPGVSQTGTDKGVAFEFFEAKRARAFARTFATLTTLD